MEMANEWLQMLQDVSSNPNVAYGLLILGLWAGMVAWAVPGTGLPEAAAVKTNKIQSKRCRADFVSAAKKKKKKIKKLTKKI
jgi:altronate dehydratase